VNLADAFAQAVSLLLTGDAALWRIVATTLAISLGGLALATGPALVVGYVIAIRQFPGKRAAVTLVQTMLSLPTVVVGLVLYLLLSRAGPLGGLGLLFTPQGMMLGQAIIAFPVLTAFTLAAVQALDRQAHETAIALGASPLGAFATVIREARFGVMAAVVNGFGRVISEVGAALMIGGNILGMTRTMTTAIALETSKGEFAQGIALGLVLIVVALAINFALSLLQGRGGMR
jgi:tungstate transport system permease protein